MYEILDQKDKGIDSIVTVKICKERLSKVNGEVVPTLDKSTNYHTELHNNKIQHDHRHDSIQTTILVVNPVTDEKIRSQIQTLLDCECFDIGEEEPINHEIEEVCTVDGQDKTSYLMHNCPQRLRDIITEKFPNEDQTDFSAMSSDLFHSVLQEKVITVLKYSNKQPLLRCPEGHIGAIATKYCLTSNKIYDKRYVLCDETHPLLPTECSVICRSYNKVYDADFIFPEHYDLYFTGDPLYVEAAFDLPHKVGAYSTWYGATIVNNEIVRVKQYIYDYNNAFSDWDEILQVTKDAVNSSTVFQDID